jgi:uncharacterized protein YqeY
MSLSEKIQAELAKAIKARDKERLSALRMIRSSIQNREIEKRAPLTDDEVVETLSSLVKKHKESIEQFRLGKREDLVQKEQAGLQVTLSFLPQQMDDDEIKEHLAGIIQELRAEGLKDLGDVMKTAMSRLKGRAEGRIVQQIAREMLSSPRA